MGQINDYIRRVIKDPSIQYPFTPSEVHRAPEGREKLTVMRSGRLVYETLREYAGGAGTYWAREDVGVDFAVDWLIAVRLAADVEQAENMLEP